MRCTGLKQSTCSGIHRNNSIRRNNGTHRNNGTATKKGYRLAGMVGGGGGGGGKGGTLSLRAFSYLAKSLSDLKVELAASHTYLKSF